MNIFIHGTVIISLVTLFFGFLAAGSLEETISILIDFYLMKLLPWPFDEAYAVQTAIELAFSHAITIIVGVVSASYRYHQAI